MENTVVRVIKQIMLEKNLTQLDIINRSGMNQSTISHILTGKRESSHKHLPVICSALEIKMSNFYQRVAELEREKEKQSNNSKINFSEAFDLIAEVVKD